MATVISGILTRSRGTFEEVLGGADLLVEVIGGIDPAREYVLRYRLSIRVYDGKGHDYLASTPLYAERDISYNDSLVLTKESEEALLYRDMQNDLVQQILRRLSAIPARANPG